jgi:hypothetical protein
VVGHLDASAEGQRQLRPDALDDVAHDAQLDAERTMVLDQRLGRQAGHHPSQSVSLRP